MPPPARQPLLPPEIAQAQSLSQAGRHDEAIALLSKLLIRQPSCFPARIALIIACYNARRISDAIAAARSAKVAAYTREQRIESVGHLIKVLSSATLHQLACDEARELSRLCPADPRIAMSCAFLTNYSDALSAAEIAESHRAASRALAAIPALPPAPVARDPLRPLRLAFLSQDLRDHSVAYFLRPLLRHLPRDQFRVVCYSATTIPDEVTRELKSLSDEFIDVAALNDLQLAQQLRADRTDIAIDLAGLTNSSRATALARAPAPLQLTYCGYANTSGIPNIHYRLVDSITDPPAFDAFSTESLIRLPRCFLCYDPGPLPPLPPLADGPIIFTSFNAANKLSPTSARLWSRVLRAVPDARLLLKSFAFKHEFAREHITRLFHDSGAPADSICFAPCPPAHDEHLTAYGQTHIALDPTPYNGTTTTCEALVMGVPVVTPALDPARDRHAARVGRSLLTAAGCPELIAHDDDHFVELCRALAADRPRLAAYRSTLRGTILASELCNQPAAAAAFGNSLRTLWCQFCTQSQPAP